MDKEIWDKLNAIGLDDFASLEEILANTEVEYPIEEDYSGEEFKPGDIIMANKLINVNNLYDVIDAPHRLFLISSVKDYDESSHIYTGYYMSSNVIKSNMAKHGYPTNLYIQNYNSILKRPITLDKDCFINIESLYTCTDKDLSDRGVYKGTTKQEFRDFVNKARKEYLNGSDISEYTWENNQANIPTNLDSAE